MIKLNSLVFARLIKIISCAPHSIRIQWLSYVKRGMIIKSRTMFVIRIWGHFKLHFYPINNESRAEKGNEVFNINKSFVYKYVSRKQYDNHTEQIAPDKFQGGFHLRAISRNCFVRRHINILSLLQTHNTTKSLSPIFISISKDGNL